MRSCSARFSRISSFFLSRNCCGMPIALDCAESSSVHSSPMNDDVFFSRKPVRWSCISFGSTFSARSCVST